jgi:hypothetical protein
MTQRKISNSLYDFVKGSISNVLPLEYAIRASEASSPAITEQLRQIDLQIKQTWKALGASELEIDSEQLMDFAWDVLQIGFPLVRRHTKLYDPVLLRIIKQGLNEIKTSFQESFTSLELPASRFFRICDLLNGNDIGKLMTEVSRALTHAQTFIDSDEIDLCYFECVRAREPIYLCPGVKYVQGNFESGKENFGLLIDLNEHISVEEFHRQIHEFTYQYALLRASTRAEHDTLSRSLIQSFLERDVQGKHSEYRIERLDGFASQLSGLYCWDIAKRHGMKLDGAISETVKVYPKPIGEDAIRKNYRAAKTAIEKAKRRFSVRDAADKA